MSLYREIVPPLDKMLVNLDSWLDAAIEHAKARNFDPEVFVRSRLAPDQFDLRKQVQTTCDQAKFAAARVSGKEPPKHPDTEQTMGELKARIQTVREYLATFSEKDFEGAESRVVPLFFLPGKGMLATDWLREFALPNIYFHATTAYAILRAAGVPHGKSAYIGALTLRDL